MSLVTKCHHPLSPPLSPPNGSPSDSLSLTPPIIPPTHPSRAREENANIGRRKGVYSEGFEAFFAEYPRKEDKARAYEEWKALNPSQELQSEIIDHLRKRIKFDEGWKQDNGKWIPYAVRFLKHRRWEDPVKPSASGGGESYMQKYIPGELMPWEK